jgi:flagellar motor component MotA
MKWIKTLFYVFFIYAAVMLTSAIHGIPIKQIFEPSALLFVCAGWIFIFANYSFSEVMQAFGQAAGLMPGVAQSRVLSQQIITAIGNYGLLAAGTINLIMMFAALANLDEPKALGIAFAVSLRPLVWALTAKVFIGIPLQNNLRYQQEEV